MGNALQLLLLGNCPDIDGLMKSEKKNKNLYLYVLENILFCQHFQTIHCFSPNLKQPCTNPWTNTTNLGWDGTFNTAELLDGTVEIVSVANHDAHYELHVGLQTVER